MRRMIRTFTKTNVLFSVLNIIFDLGHIFCILMPVSLFGLSPILCFAIAFVVYILDRPAPVIAWLLHFALWCISIKFILACQTPKLVTVYIICAIAYFLVEIVCTGFIVLAGTKQKH